MKANLPATVTQTIIATVFFLSVPASADTGAKDNSWTDQIDFGGDIRLRYEFIDDEFKNERDRERFRARFGFSTHVNDHVKVFLALATGGGNPVSTNQSFDDGFSVKEIGLNLGYISWTANNSLTIDAGKMKNPLFKAGKAPLIWDSDLNPEGVAAIFKSGIFFGTVAAFTVDERSSSGESRIYAAQGGVKIPVGESKLTLGFGYFEFTNTIGNEPFYDGNPRGNTVDVDGNYVYAYKDTEVFAQYDTSVGGWPLQLFVHYTQNHEVSVQDTAFAFGAKFGSAKKKGDFDVALIHQDIEADALIGTYNDSDFAGGGTDSEGHMLKSRYGLAENIFLVGTLFINTRDRFQGVEHDYNRLQIDLEFRFE
jgi:putative porin